VGSRYVDVDVDDGAKRYGWRLAVGGWRQRYVVDIHQPTFTCVTTPVFVFVFVVRQSLHAGLVVDGGANVEVVPWVDVHVGVCVAGCAGAHEAACAGDVDEDVRNGIAHCIHARNSAHKNTNCDGLKQYNNCT